MSEDAAREMNLEEVSLLYGDHHYAARQYVRLANGIRMMRHCGWWEVFRKRNIKKMLIEIIDDNDKARR